MPRKKKQSGEEESLPAGSSAQTIMAAAAASFGSDLIKILGKVERTVVKGISWGSPGFNYRCTGNPFVGLVEGRIYEIFGVESSGKTTLGLHAIAEAQREGKTAAIIDAEPALDVNYASQLGVDLEQLLISQPSYGEEALNVVERLVELGTSLILVDSVAALVPKAEIDGEMGDAHMGLQARMMGQAMRKLTGKIAKSKSVVIFINQIRMKIGVMFGSPETTTGGNALKFYSSIRIRMATSTAKNLAITGASDTITSTGDKARIGSVMSIKVVKNKVYKPFGEWEVPLYYGHGIDIVKDWYEFANEFKIITKAAGSYFLPDGKNKIKVPYADIGNHLSVVQRLVKEGLNV